jgi:hypothetical protein
LNEIHNCTGNRVGGLLQEEVEKLKNWKMKCLKRESPETVELIENMVAKCLYFFAKKMYSIKTGAVVDQSKMIQILMDTERYGQEEIVGSVNGNIVANRIIKLYRDFVNLIDEHLGITKFSFGRTMTYLMLEAAKNTMPRKTPFADEQTSPAMISLKNLLSYHNIRYWPSLEIGHIVGRLFGGTEVLSNLQGEGSFANKYIKYPIECFYKRKLKNADFGRICFGVLTKSDLPPETVLNDNPDFEEFVEFDGEMLCYALVQFCIIYLFEGGVHKFFTLMFGNFAIGPRNDNLTEEGADKFVGEFAVEPELLENAIGFGIFSEQMMIEGVETNIFNNKRVSNKLPSFPDPKNLTPMNGMSSNDSNKLEDSHMSFNELPNELNDELSTEEKVAEIAGPSKRKSNENDNFNNSIKKQCHNQ